MYGPKSMALRRSWVQKSAFGEDSGHSFNMLQHWVSNVQDTLVFCLVSHCPKAKTAKLCGAHGCSCSFGSSNCFRHGHGQFSSRLATPGVAWAMTWMISLNARQPFGQRFIAALILAVILLFSAPWASTLRLVAARR